MTIYSIVQLFVHGMIKSDGSETRTSNFTTHRRFDWYSRKIHLKAQALDGRTLLYSRPLAMDNRALHPARMSSSPDEKKDLWRLSSEGTVRSSVICGWSSPSLTWCTAVGVTTATCRAFFCARWCASISEEERDTDRPRLKLSGVVVDVVIRGGPTVERLLRRKMSSISITASLQ